MKNFVVLFVLSLFLSLPLQGLHMICKYGIAHLYDFDGAGEYHGTAGGCYGTWIIELEILDPNNPNHVHDSYMANLINQYFIVGGHLPQSEIDELEDIYNNNTATVKYIDLQYIDADIRDDVRDAMTD